jgi:excisionase family DNA binding protein
MLDNDDALLLRIPKAADRLGLGRSKFYELIASGEIETVRIGRAVRVPADALEDFVQRLRAAGQYN